MEDDENSHLFDKFKCECNEIDSFISIKIETWYKFFGDKSEYPAYCKKTEKGLKSFINSLNNIDNKTIFVDLNVHQLAGYVPESPSYLSLDILFKKTGELDNIATLSQILSILKNKNLFEFSKNKQF